MNELISMGGKRCKKGISDISEGFNDALRLAADGDELKAYVLLLDVVKMSEKSACNLRELVSRYGYPEEQEELEQIVLGSHPVDIGFTEEGWFVVRMDPLAKTKALASKQYIRGIIAPAMRKFFAGKPNVRYPKCVLIFRHVYDRNFPVRHMRDYDNVEVKQVTDVVAMYVMVDDNPVNCRTYHCCAVGNCCRTEVYVVPQDEFIQWYHQEPDIPDEGVLLLDQVPDKWKII
jgi:hypothetical protein